MRDLTYSDKGKPFLKEGPFFSISHSHTTLVLLLSFDHPVGVDIEHLRPLPHFKKIAQRFFTLDDINYVNNSLAHFYELWTKKEAFIKLLGKHIFDPEFKTHEKAYYYPLSIPDYEGYACSLQTQNHTFQSFHVPHEYETNEFSLKI
jgi:4'-phosphopantetheinyl transferase